MIVADEDATAELKVKTVKYFKSIRKMHESVYDVPLSISTYKRALDPFVKPRRAWSLSAIQSRLD